jgi:hypothetical protein
MCAVSQLVVAALSGVLGATAPAVRRSRRRMRQVAAPSGADIADHAAKVLAARLQGRDGT